MYHPCIFQPWSVTPGQQTLPFIAHPPLALKIQSFPGAGGAESKLLCWGEGGSDAKRSPVPVEVAPGGSNSGVAMKIYHIPTYAEKLLHW